MDDNSNAKEDIDGLNERKKQAEYELEELREHKKDLEDLRKRKESVEEEIEEKVEELGNFDEWNSTSDIFDDIHDKYTQKGDDGTITVSEKGVGPMEILYKHTRARMLAEEEPDELRGWAIEGMTLARLANQILDELEKASEYDDTKDWEIRFVVSDEFVLYYTLANEVIQSLAGEIIDEELFDGTRRGESSLESAREYPQEVKEDLLFYSGMVDNGLKGEMANVRRTRNKLIHDLRNRQYLSEIENVESRLFRAQKVINELHDLVYGFTLIDNEEDL